MVDLTRDQERERRREALLEVRRNLARRVELRPERRHAQLVPRRETRERVSPSLARNELQVGGDVDLVAQLLPVRRLQDARALHLRRRDPVAVRRRVLGHVRRRDFGHVRGRPLEDGLDAEREVFGDGLEIRADVDASAVCETGVDCLGVQRVI